MKLINRALQKCNFHFVHNEIGTFLNREQPLDYTMVGGAEPFFDNTMIMFPSHSALRTKIPQMLL